MRTAEEDCRQDIINFLPVAGKTLWGWHEVVEVQIKKLTSAMARHTGQGEGEAISHTCDSLETKCSNDGVYVSPLL